MRPKILLDIDGVFNPFLSFTLQEDGYQSVSYGWAEWSLKPEHGVWLQALSLHADLIWVSSWNEQSNGANRFWEIPAFPFVPLTIGEGNEDTTWKLETIQTYLENDNSPVIWADDELKPDAFAWALARGNTFLIKCEPDTGLTKEQFKQIYKTVKSFTT